MADLQVKRVLTLPDRERQYRPQTSMVRRGSTVRVRQRAFLELGSRCKGDFFVAAMDTADHLLRKEGVDALAEAEDAESCWNHSILIAIGRAELAA